MKRDYRSIVLNTHVMYSLGFRKEEEGEWVLMDEDRDLRVFVSELPGKANDPIGFISRAFFVGHHQVWDLLTLIYFIHGYYKNDYAVKLLLSRVDELNMDWCLPVNPEEWLGRDFAFHLKSE